MSEYWHKQAAGKVHDKQWQRVREIETAQGLVFERFVKLEALYDPYSPMGNDTDASLANVQENVVASNIDTVDAAVSTNDVRARFMTDGAHWSVQRRARALEYYAEGLGKLTGRRRKCRLAFKASAKKGNGVVKVTADRWGEVRTEYVPIEDIFVDDEDTRSDGLPREIHHVQRSYDKEQLKAEYPEHAAEIEAACRSMMRRGTYRSGTADKLVVIDSIRLPIGKKPPKGTRTKRGARYVPGRRVISIESLDLLDEDYHKPYFPLGVICWLSREGSFYGISLAERIAGIQRALNKRNWQIDRALDQNATLTTYVRPADGNLAVKTTKIGNIVPIKGDYPQTPTPPAVHPETYRSRLDLKDAAFEESGVSRLAAQSHKPAGLDSGRALREYRDQTTQRFAPQEADFEQLVLDVTWLELDACKDLGAEAPVIYRRSRWRPRIEWSKVDMGETRVQIAASSTLNRTPAGREQTLIEWAQAGVISTDEFRRLIGHPDLERAMSLYTAAMESIEEQLEMMLDGEVVMPEPFDNLSMAVWRGTAEYHNARTGGAPEPILEAIRQYVDQAAFMLEGTSASNGNISDGGAAAPGALPPPSGQPAAALSPQAMDLMAG